MMRASRAVSTTSRVMVARLLISRIRVIWAKRASDESEVAAGDAGDGGDGFGVGEVAGGER